MAYPKIHRPLSILWVSHTGRAKIVHMSQMPNCEKYRSMADNFLRLPFFAWSNDSMYMFVTNPPQTTSPWMIATYTTLLTSVPLLHMAVLFRTGPIVSLYNAMLRYDMLASSPTLQNSSRIMAIMCYE